MTYFSPVPLKAMSSANRSCDPQHATRGRHTSVNQFGELCVTVVDPVSRKLLVPVQYVYRTRAQQRNTLPSLCLLFLNRRCRQGAECFQVHANREVVQLLRNEIDSLPCCCVAHGDADRNTEADLPLDPTVVFVPGCKPTTHNGGYLPLDCLSYTAALRRLLQGPVGASDAVPDSAVLDASGYTICRLHALDRCRYAEDCKFLHICKEITLENPGLITLASLGTAASASATSSEHKPTAAQSHTVVDRDAPAAMSPGLGPRGHVSVFTAVTRRQQHHNEQFSSAASSFPTPAPSFCGYSGLGPICNSVPTPTNQELALFHSNHIGTWLASPPPPTAQMQYSLPHTAGTNGFGSCTSFQDGGMHMASSMPPFFQLTEGSQSFSTVGYSNASMLAPMSPLKTSTTTATTAASNAQSTTRRPLLVPLCEGSLTNTTTTTTPSTTQPQPDAGSLGREVGAHHSGHGSSGSLHSSGENEGHSHSGATEELGTPGAETTIRRDVRDPSRWSYNPYGNSLLL